MQMNKQERFLIKMNRIITYSIIIGLCFFISYISVNGTNAIAQRNSVGNISYKLPDTWNAVESEKQFRNKFQKKKEKKKVNQKKK